VSGNPYVRELGWGRALELLDPRSEAVTLVGNYAPVHLLLHGLEWKVFGSDVRGYHVVNAVLHALNAALLALLLARSGVAWPAALGGALFFLFHPANVEAVAWISQLKTVSSLLLALLALLAFERRPSLATAAFVLALLTKVTAVFAIPVVAVLLWVRSPGKGGGPGSGGRTWLWLALWAALFVAFAMVQLAAFRQGSLSIVPVDPDPWVRLRTSIALGMRYLAMAATSFGVSAYHEPGPARSLLDPWWLAGLVALAALAARAAVALRERREEAAWWVWAAVSFLPVSQLLPFRFPLADRYLYPLLPGLIGGVLLAAQALLPRLGDLGPWARRGAAALVVTALVLLGVRSHGRAELWSHPPRLLADAAAHYPDGSAAHLLRAREAAERGDSAEAVLALQGALERGFDRFDQLFGDPAFAALAWDPGYQAVVAQMAWRWIERLGSRTNRSQAELYSLALAYRVRGELAEARQALELGLERGGPLDETIRAALQALAAEEPR
jgi:hypothetical protein